MHVMYMLTRHVQDEKDVVKRYIHCTRGQLCSDVYHGGMMSMLTT